MVDFIQNFKLIFFYFKIQKLPILIPATENALGQTMCVPL